MGVERGEGGKMRKWEAGPGSSQSQARGGRRGSKGSLPGSAGSREGPFQLLIGDKHHHVPRTQTEEGRHEPRGDKTQVTGGTSTSRLPCWALASNPTHVLCPKGG